MMLERTHDMQLVARIMGHSAIWPYIHDDGVDVCAPEDHEALHWMLVNDDDGMPGGVFLVHAQNSYCYEMHTCLLPRLWGRQAAYAAQLLLAWAFTETQCLKMVSNVPANNRQALRFALAGGMVKEGVNRASYMQRGELVDQILVGITKKEWELCQQQQS